MITNAANEQHRRAQRDQNASNRVVEGGAWPSCVGETDGTITTRDGGDGGDGGAISLVSRPDRGDFDGMTFAAPRVVDGVAFN